MANGALPGNMTLTDAQTACLREHGPSLLPSFGVALAVSLSGGVLGYRVAKSYTDNTLWRIIGALGGWYMTGRFVSGPLLLKPAVMRIARTCELPFPVST